MTMQKMIFLANNLLMLFMSFPLNFCYAADEWSYSKEFLPPMEFDFDLGGEFLADFSDQDEELPEDDTEPVKIEESSESHKRNFEEAFAEQAITMQRPRKKATREKTSQEILEERKTENLEYFHTNKKSLQMNIDNNHEKLNFLYYEAPLWRKKIEEQYANGPQHKLEKEKQILEEWLATTYAAKELAIFKRQLAQKQIEDEQEQNILFNDLFIGIDHDIIFPGLPYDLWGIIFEFACDSDCQFRPNFALVSRRAYEIAKAHTKKLKIPYIKPNKLDYMLSNYRSANQVNADVYNNKFYLDLATDILLKDTSLRIKHVTLNAEIIRKNTDLDGLSRLDSMELVLRTSTALPVNFIDKLTNLSNLTIKQVGFIYTTNTFNYDKEEIKKLTNLRSLSFTESYGHRIDDAIITALTKLTYLAILESTEATYAALSITDDALNKLTNLVQLSVPDRYKTYNAGIDFSLLNKNIKLLGDDSKYKKLKIVGFNTVCELSKDPSICWKENFGKLENLMQHQKAAVEELHLCQDNVEMTTLVLLKNLTELHLDICVNIGIATLKQLKNLKILDLGNNKKIEDRHFIQLTFLESLSLPRNNKKSIGSSNGLQYLTNLTKLNLRDSSQVSDIRIKGLTKLRELNLGEAKNITNNGISSLTNLRKLDLGENSQISVRILESLPNLQELK